MVDFSSNETERAGGRFKINDTQNEIYLSTLAVTKTNLGSFLVLSQARQTVVRNRVDKWHAWFTMPFPVKLQSQSYDPVTDDQNIIYYFVITMEAL